MPYFKLLGGYLGKYYLADAGYTTQPGFILPYCGERYHLKDYLINRNPTNPRNCSTTSIRPYECASSTLLDFSNEASRFSLALLHIHIKHRSPLCMHVVYCTTTFLAAKAMGYFRRKRHGQHKILGTLVSTIMIYLSKQFLGLKRRIK